MHRPSSVLFAAVAFTLLTAPRSILASDPDVLTKGGQMYDKLSTTLGLKKPTATHPSYLASGKKKGAASWRCKECHG